VSGSALHRNAGSVALGVGGFLAATDLALLALMNPQDRIAQMLDPVFRVVNAAYFPAFVGLTVGLVAVHGATAERRADGWCTPGGLAAGSRWLPPGSRTSCAGPATGRRARQPPAPPPPPAGGAGWPVMAWVSCWTISCNGRSSQLARTTPTQSVSG
jgi:hypothetical protein